MKPFNEPPAPMIWLTGVPRPCSVNQLTTTESYCFKKVTETEKFQSQAEQPQHPQIPQVAYLPFLWHSITLLFPVQAFKMQYLFWLNFLISLYWKTCRLVAGRTGLWIRWPMRPVPQSLRLPGAFKASGHAVRDWKRKLNQGENSTSWPLDPQGYK